MPHLPSVVRNDEERIAVDIQLIREYIVFSRFLNFSKAAAYLNISQPTLSSHIANMEHELGFQLVARLRPLCLTPAGKKFYRDAGRFLQMFDSSVAECKELS